VAPLRSFEAARNEQSAPNIARELARFKPNHSQVVGGMEVNTRNRLFAFSTAAVIAALGIRPIRRIGQLVSQSQGRGIARRNAVDLPTEAMVRPGPLPEVFQRLVILGIRGELVDAFNQPNALSGPFTKDVVVEIPEGTTQIFAAITGFFLSFGRVQALGGGAVNISPDDHHLGIEFAAVTVQEIGKVTATLRIFLMLTDDNGDDPWSGRVAIRLLFLGPG
jgi:hypothetical protein